MTPKEVEKAYDIPKNVAERLMNMYAESNLATKNDTDRKRKFEYSKTKKLQDRLICHFIILMLIIYDYEINAKWIISALKIEFSKLVKYFRIISCTPKHAKAKIQTNSDMNEEINDAKRVRKDEWALDKSGSLFVQLKVKNKRKKKQVIIQDK